MLEEYGLELNEMYHHAPEGRKGTMFLLFGILHAKEIKSNGFTPGDIIAASGLKKSFATEINKGIRLADYVSVNDDIVI